MKKLPLLLFVFALPALGVAQDSSQDQHTAIREVVNQYNNARSHQDTALLNSILTDDIDQLVSTGVWRKGRDKALLGMQQSSQNNPGSRTITVEQIRLLTAQSAVADARYVIQNEDGSSRKMWSTFLLVRSGASWKIAGIRNMLPSQPD